MPSSSVLLLVLALLHSALAVYLGLTDGGDYSLLWVAAPLMALTALAAVAVLGQAPWRATAAIVLTSLALALTVALVPAYLVGLFHLPQSVLALAVALRHERRRV